MKPGILLFTIALTFTAVHAQAASHRQLRPRALIKFSLAKLEKTYRDTPSLQAKFTQVVYEAALARTKTSSGTLDLAHPNLLRWEVLKPSRNITVSNGKKLWFYTPLGGTSGKGQVIVRPAEQLTRQPLFRILTGAANITKELKKTKEQQITGLTPENPITILTFVPKKRSLWGDMKDVVLKVDSSYHIREVVIHGFSGNQTKIELINQTFGKKLTRSNFNFTPPPGADIVSD